MFLIERIRSVNSDMMMYRISTLISKKFVMKTTITTPVILLMKTTTMMLLMMTTTTISTTRKTYENKDNVYDNNDILT